MCNKNLSRDLAVAMREGTVRIDPPRTTAFSVNKVLLRSLAVAMRDGIVQDRIRGNGLDEIARRGIPILARLERIEGKLDSMQTSGCAKAETHERTHAPKR